MQKIILVTGASGFVGRHLCPELLRSGYKVRAIYRGPKPPNELPEGIDWIAIDSIGPDTDWGPVLRGGVTHVVHLAAVAHRISRREQLSENVYNRVNNLGTAVLARAVANTPSVQRFIFMSSIGAITSLAKESVNEKTPCRPDTPYGKSKLAAEMAVQNELESSHVEWCVFRTPLLYGPGNPGNMKRLLSLLKLKIPLPLGSIHNRRTFLFVGNLVDAIGLALVHPDCGRKIFCVGDTQDLSTPELLRRLAASSGVRRFYLFSFPLIGLRLVGAAGSLFEAISGRSVGIDINAIEKLCGSLPVDSSFFQCSTGWHPPFSIEYGLTATVCESSGSARC